MHVCLCVCVMCLSVPKRKNTHFGNDVNDGRWTKLFHREKKTAL